MTDTILLPTDGSESASEATAHAIALAARTGATLHAVYVVDTRDVGEPALSSMAVVVDEDESRGYRVLEAVRQAAENHGVVVETRCCHGDPTEEIPALADAIEADLIVMGERGQTHEIQPGEVTRKLSQEDDRVVIA